MRAKLKHLIRKAIGDPPQLLEEMPNAPGLFHYYRDLIATGHERVAGGWKYDGKFYPDYLTVGGAIFWILPKAQPFCQGRGLDIGAGAWPFPGATAIDAGYGEGSTQVSDIPDGSQDFVFSSHTLEHIAAWQDALRQWVGKLKPGGVLFLYIPHPDCGLWRKENPFMAQHHAWVPTPDVVRAEVEAIGCQILSYDDKADFMYGFHVCGRKPE